MTTSWAEPRSEFTDLSSNTQKARVKEILRSAADNGVCSLFFYDIGIPNGRTRVYELRDDDGLEIETIPCPRDLHDSKTPNHVRFRGRWWKPYGQLRLI